MKMFLAAAVALSILGVSFAASADVPATPNSLCQQGGAVAACPSGVPSNISASVADAYSHYGAVGQSVSGQISNGNSVGGQAYTTQSVAATNSSVSNGSVAWSQQQNGSSVASGSGAGFSSGDSVAYGSSGGSSVSVVH